VVERLPSKHEALSSNLSTYKKQTKKPHKTKFKAGDGQFAECGGERGVGLEICTWMSSMY
jgi:hypothetical protein